jgi:hypothetical protein
MSDTNAGKYTDEDLQNQPDTEKHTAEPQGEYTDTETVSEARSDDGQTHDVFANDGVGDGELDLEDRTKRHD